MDGGTQAESVSPLFVSLNFAHASLFGQAWVVSQYGVQTPFIGSVVAMQTRPAAQAT